MRAANHDYAREQAWKVVSLTMLEEGRGTIHKGLTLTDIQLGNETFNNLTASVESSDVYDTDVTS